MILALTLPSGLASTALSPLARASSSGSARIGATARECPPARLRRRVLPRQPGRAAAATLRYDAAAHPQRPGCGNEICVWPSTYCCPAWTGVRGPRHASALRRDTAGDSRRRRHPRREASGACVGASHSATSALHSVATRQLRRRGDCVRRALPAQAPRRELRVRATRRAQPDRVLHAPRPAAAAGERRAASSRAVALVACCLTARSGCPTRHTWCALDLCCDGGTACVSEPRTTAARSVSEPARLRGGDGEARASPRRARAAAPPRAAPQPPLGFIPGRYAFSGGGSRYSIFSTVMMPYLGLAAAPPVALVKVTP